MSLRTERIRRIPAIRLTAFLACAIVLVELLSLVPVGHDLSVVPTAVRGPVADTPVPTTWMSAAEAALASGAGPANGTPWSCSSAPSVEAGVQCGPATTAGSGMGPTLPTWTSAVPPVPTARGLGSMVYDARDGYVLLFGGFTASGDLKDTWKYLGGRWTELSPATSPSVREGAGIAFDTKDNYVVLFGGLSGTAGVLSDTWTWAAGAWTKLAPATHPTARAAPSMTYDAKDGYVVLFGGLAAGSAAQSDTWKFVGGVWTKLALTVHRWTTTPRRPRPSCSGA
jgi:hypothetical protein